MEYTVKKVRNFKGMDWDGYNADLHRDGRKVAFVIQDGSGGEPEFRFVSKEEEEILRQYCKTLPPRRYNSKTLEADPNGDDSFEVTMDLFVGRLVDEFNKQRWIDRQCNGNILYRLPSDPEDKWWKYKGVYGESVKDFLTKKYGPGIEILNEKATKPKA